MKAKPELRRECVRLRVEERLSLKEIHKATGAATGSLSTWLKPHPLTKEELRERKSSRPSRQGIPYKDRGGASKHYESVIGKDLTGAQKGKIAEAAVLFRLALHGFASYSSASGGDHIDWIVEVPESKRLLRLEVRWAGEDGKGGLPRVSLRCSNGRGKSRRYDDSDFDFLVGYDLFTDTAYVFSVVDLGQHRNRITIRPENAERWEKLRS